MQRTPHAPRRDLLGRRPGLRPSEFGGDRHVGADPVSYTHLDVYKRQDLTFAEGRLPVSSSPVDVMVALVEQSPAGLYPVSATQMSDGTLRYLSILGSLLSLRGGSPRDAVAPPHRTMVIEEIENGLFPDQAARVLQLLREEAGQDGVTLIASTHSPALLDAVNPDDHEGIVICERDEQGRGALTSLINHCLLYTSRCV